MSDALTVELLRGADLVDVAQCAAIDADAFPYASAVFASRSTRDAVLVAREPGGGPVIGFLAARFGRAGLSVQGVAVRRDRRRRGVARALVRAAVERAEAAGVRDVSLCVSVTNRAAITLYEREGFVPVERLGGYYPPQVYGGSGDALRMRRGSTP